MAAAERDATAEAVEAPLPTGRRLFLRLLWWDVASSGYTVAIIAAFLGTFLHLRAEHWTGFAQAIAGVSVLASAAINPLRLRVLAPLTGWLDDPEAGHDPARSAAAFARAVGLPATQFGFAMLWYLLGAGLVTAIMGARYDDFGLAQAGVMIGAALAGGLVGAVSNAYWVKHELAPVREHLARAVGDPDRRAALVVRLPLAWKLGVSLCGVLMVAVIFSVFLAYRSARDATRELVLLQQAVWLEQAAEAAARDDGATLARLQAEGRRLHLASALVLLDAEGRVMSGSGDALATPLRRDLARSAEATGSQIAGEGLLLGWRRLEGGWTAVALVEEDELPRDAMDRMLGIFVLLAMVSLSVAVLMARHVTSDITRAVGRLSESAARLADGDLRPTRAFESEDELGDLGRAFERMAAGLRATVTGVLEAGGRMSAAALELSRVETEVSEGAREQAHEIQAATEAVEAIDGQGTGLFEAAESLNGSVEESSSSVAELAASVRELDATGEALGGRVETVSTSIEEMDNKVGEIDRHTEELEGAASQTAAAAAQMAGSIREVDENCEEAGRLTERVVEAATGGRAVVRETIRGMEAIREATDTAAAAIRTLGHRTDAIGQIVGVIDGVADETGLLALNAAIIAAQAGEQGRAFAVVAGEIKELANRVLMNTREIAELIESVQREAVAAVEVVDEGQQRVAEGVERSGRAGVALDEITDAARESGARVAGIVKALGEQSETASSVAGLAAQLHEGLRQIRAAAAVHARESEVLLEGASVMRASGEQLVHTTGEQTRGASQIQAGIDVVSRMAERIHEALQGQSRACGLAAESMARVLERTHSNEEAAGRLASATAELRDQAQVLGRAVDRFRL